jgi:hypothetical protein
MITNFAAQHMSRALLLSIVGVTLVTGFCVSVWPAVTFAGLLLLGGTLLLTRSIRPVATMLIVFLIVQDPLVFLAGGEFSANGLIVKRIDEVLILAYAASVLCFSHKARMIFHDRKLMLAIAGCFLGIIASSIAQSTSVVPATIDLVLFSKPFLLLAIGTSLAPSDSEIRRMLDPALRAMLIVVVFAVVFLLFPQWQDAYIGAFRAPDERIGILSAQGFFDGPGPYSWFCAATFALAYAGYLFYGRRAYAGAALLSAIFLVLSWRRKSIAGLVAMLFVALLLRDTGAQRRLRALAVLSLAVILTVTVLAPYAQGIVSYTAKEYGNLDPHSNARIALHYTSVLIARDHFPLGTGLASFGSHASRLYYSNVYDDYGISHIWGLSPEYSSFVCDTFWPMVLGEGGAVAFLSYCFFLYLLCATAWRGARSSSHSIDNRFFSTFVLFVLAGSLFESTSSQIYGSSMQSSLVMIPAGALLSMHYAGNRPRGDSDQDANRR